MARCRKEMEMNMSSSSSNDETDLQDQDYQVSDDEESAAKVLSGELDVAQFVKERQDRVNLKLDKKFDELKTDMWKDNEEALAEFNRKVALVREAHTHFIKQAALLTLIVRHAGKADAFIDQFVQVSKKVIQISKGDAAYRKKFMKRYEATVYRQLKIKTKCVPFIEAFIKYDENGDFQLNVATNAQIEEMEKFIAQIHEGHKLDPQEPNKQSTSKGDSHSATQPGPSKKA